MSAKIQSLQNPDEYVYQQKDVKNFITLFALILTSQLTHVSSHYWCQVIILWMNYDMDNTMMQIILHFVEVTLVYSLYCVVICVVLDAIFFWFLPFCCLENWGKKMVSKAKKKSSFDDDPNRGSFVCWSSRLRWRLK